MACCSPLSSSAYIFPRDERPRSSCIRPPSPQHELRVSMSDDFEPHVFKIVIVGDHRVGKTSLLHRWRGDCFEPFTKPTIGFDLCVGDFHLSDGIVRLQVWDTAGQEKFSCVTTVQFRNAKGIIFVYDVSARQSFERIADYWLDRVDMFIDEPVPIFLVANKMDLLPESRMVTSEEGQKLATAQAANGFFETSAKSGEQVTELFETIAQVMHKTWGICKPHIDHSQSFCQNCGRCDEDVFSARNRQRRLASFSRRSPEKRCCRGAPKLAEAIALNRTTKGQRSPFEPRALPRS